MYTTYRSRSLNAPLLHSRPRPRCQWDQSAAALAVAQALMAATSLPVKAAALPQHRPAWPY